MKQTGVTSEGQPVFGEVAQLSTTYGFPLEMTLERFKANGWVVDWMDYIETCMADGAKPRTIKARILTAVGEVYGAKYRDQVEARLVKIKGFE